MKTLVFIGLFAAALTSCTKERLEANGNKITDVRNPGTFDGVSSSGSNRVFITHGEEFHVELRGSSNLVSSFETKVRGNTLELGYKNASVSDDDVEVYITMPELEFLALTGSGEMSVRGDFPSKEKFNLRISGSGDIELHDELDVKNADIDLSGSGKAELENLHAENADIDISGSGDVKVSVAAQLRSRISGSGQVFYRGNPELDSKISGSGKVVKF
jgi:hypothetical protein